MTRLTLRPLPSSCLNTTFASGVFDESLGDATATSGNDFPPTTQCCMSRCGDQQHRGHRYADDELAIRGGGTRSPVAFRLKSFRRRRNGLRCSRSRGLRTGSVPPPGNGTGGIASAGCEASCSAGRSSCCAADCSSGCSADCDASCDAGVSTTVESTEKSSEIRACPASGYDPTETNGLRSSSTPERSSNRIAFEHGLLQFLL